MTQIDRFERELPAALRDVAGDGAYDYLPDILGRTARTRQRSAWASLERWLPMDLATPRAVTARVPWRTIGVIALVAVLLAALVAVYAGTQRRVPAPFGPAANGLIPFTRDGDIFAGDPITGAIRTLSSGPENDYAPTFSPDGTRVAFLRAGADCPKPGEDCAGGEDVVVVGSDGSGARVITSEPLAGIRAATWAADSRALYVAQGAYGIQRLARLPVDGSGPLELATGLEVDWIVVRPPAGDELMVRGVVNDRFGLFRMDTDGSNVELLAPGNMPGEGLDNNQDLNFPAYSPDGSTIYYNRYTPEHQTIEAWSMRADGSGQHRFNVDATVTGWWEGEMAPSPDGRSVAMWRVPNNGARQAITIYPADGSGPGRALGPSLRGTGQWAWAPDSSRLLVNYNDPSEGNQILVDPVTGESTNAPWAVNSQPDWQRLAP